MEISDFLGVNSDQQELKVRCPDCFQSYNVEVADLVDYNPKFKCTACESGFWVKLSQNINLNEVIVGEAMDSFSSFESGIVDANLKCPKCSAFHAANEKECPSCGIIFSSFQRQKDAIGVSANFKKSEPSYSPSPEVRVLWEKAIHDYNNFEVHQDFVAAAWADKCLDYACSKYGDILQVNPNDEIAKRAQNELSALTLVQFESEFSQNFDIVDKSDGNGSETKTTRAAVFGKSDSAFAARKINYLSVFTNLIFVGCGVMITTGILLPHLRNLIGFGVSLLFLVLALRFFVRVI